MSDAWLSLFQICLQAEEKELLKVQRRDEKRLLFERQKNEIHSRFEDKTLTLDDYKYYINDFPHIPTNIVAGVYFALGYKIDPKKNDYKQIINSFPNSVKEHLCSNPFINNKILRYLLQDNDPKYRSLAKKSVLFKSYYNKQIKILIKEGKLAKQRGQTSNFKPIGLIKDKEAFIKHLELVFKRKILPEYFLKVKSEFVKHFLLDSAILDFRKTAINSIFKNDKGERLFWSYELDKKIKDVLIPLAYFNAYNIATDTKNLPFI